MKNTTSTEYFNIIFLLYYYILAMITRLNFFTARVTQQRFYQSSEKVHAHIRKAQLIESFRSKFLEAIGSDTTIAVTDLDDLTRQNRVRPSVFISKMESLGVGIGTASKVIPGPCKDFLVNVINSVSAQHLNDSIRDLQGTGVDGQDKCIREEVKESLKYHRDVVVSDISSSSSFHLTSKSIAENVLYQIFDVSMKL